MGEVRSLVAKRLDRAMHEHEQRLDRHRHVLLIAGMVTFAVMTFIVYIYARNSELAEHYKNIFTVLLGIFIALWGVSIGLYFSGKASDNVTVASDNSDLDLYREILSAKEEEVKLRGLLKKQTMEYEDKIHELNKKVAQLEKAHESNI